VPYTEAEIDEIHKLAERLVPALDASARPLMDEYMKADNRTHYRYVVECALTWAVHLALGEGMPDEMLIENVESLIRMANERAARRAAGAS